jgi:hypothetical protein
MGKLRSPAADSFRKIHEATGLDSGTQRHGFLGDGERPRIMIKPNDGSADVVVIHASLTS